MEISEIVGMSLAIIVVVVIVLFVTSSYPDFTDEIRDLFDEVFGFTYKQMLGEQEEKDKKVSSEIFRNLKEAYGKCKGENCVCDFDVDEFPKRYKIILGEGKIEIWSNKEVILKSEELKEKICFIDSLDEINDVKRIEFTYDGGLVLKVVDKGDTEEYKSEWDYPKLYKTKDKVCVINPEAEEFINSKVCGTEKMFSEDKMKELFNDFVSRLKSCANNDVQGSCRCSGLSFKGKLQEDYEIIPFPTPDGKIFFHLTFKGKLIESFEFEGDSGEVDIGWIGRRMDDFGRSYAISSRELVPFETNKPLNSFDGYLIRVKGYLGKNKEYNGVFFSEVLPSDLSTCTIWDDVYEEGCKTYQEQRFKDIKEKGYLEKVDNLEEEKYSHRELLLLGIMATETTIDPEAVSPTGCAGLMQFCYGTAKEIPIFKGKITECCAFESRENRKNIYTICDNERKKNSYLCNEANDNRLDDEISIKAAGYLLDKKTSYFKGYSGSEIFGVAAYNVGEGNINKAIKEGKLGNSAGWQEVKKSLKKVVSSSKYEEIRCYPHKVKVYYDYFNNQLSG